MNSRRRNVALAFLLVSTSMAIAQPGGPGSHMIAPPIPDGPLLSVQNESPPPKPVRESHSLAWLEDGASVIPAGAVGQPDAATGIPPTILDSTGRAAVGGEGSAAASACHFDRWNQDGVFACGTTTSQFLLGPYFSGRPGPVIPTFNYLMVSARHGWMLGDPEERWYGRGNYEFLVDLYGSAILSGGYGTYFAGQSFLLRYNFVEPGSCLVPYQQFGAGWLLTDAYKDQNQQAIGQEFEFLLRWEIGLRYFVASNLSLDIEGGFQHISNADRSDRNHGVNAFGGQIGLTYYFPWGAQ